MGEDGHEDGHEDGQGWAQARVSKAEGGRG